MGFDLGLAQAKERAVQSLGYITSEIYFFMRYGPGRRSGGCPEREANKFRAIQSSR